MAYIDDEENEEHTFKVEQYANNLKALFSATYSDECKKLRKELEKAFKELKGSIDAIFGSVYDWDYHNKQSKEHLMSVPDVSTETTGREVSKRNRRFYSKNRRNSHETTNKYAEKIKEIDRKFSHHSGSYSSSSSSNAKARTNETEEDIYDFERKVKKYQEMFESETKEYLPNYTNYRKRDSQDTEEYCNATLSKLEQEIKENLAEFDRTINKYKDTIENETKEQVSSSSYSGSSSSTAENIALGVLGLAAGAGIGYLGHKLYDEYMSEAELADVQSVSYGVI